MTTCTAKHTQFQPTPEQWKCPKCGTGNGESESQPFFVDDGPLGGMDCDLLHEEDQVICTSCDSSWTGKRLATVMAKKLNLDICPHCNGTGFIDKK